MGKDAQITKIFERRSISHLLKEFKSDLSNESITLKVCVIKQLIYYTYVRLNVIARVGNL